MFILYDLIFIIFALCYLPVYVFKRKFHPGFLTRLGIFPQNVKKALAGQRPIWLHTVSVGEILASQLLIKELYKEYPNKQIVISTVTPTGNRIAQSIVNDKDFVFYLPFDISLIVRYVVKLINPCLFVIAETEIWPNLISCLNKHSIPIVTVNARISDSSFRGYRLIKLLTKPILNKIKLFCVQTETDANRLFELGVAKEKIKITGNMKFDTSTTFSVNGERPFDSFHSLRVVPSDVEGRSRTIDNAEPQSAQINDKGALADYAEKRLKLGLQDTDTLLTAGSTHRGEEEIIVRVYKNLLLEFPSLKLLIAPRHPERTKEIEDIVVKYGFNSERVSVLNRQTGKQANRQTVFILDVIGQLMSFYAISDIIFVGGSLIKKGGHNILEPAVFAKPILCGPYMFNFRDITDLFLRNKACVLIHNEEELLEKIKYLLNNLSIMIELGTYAKGLILENRGATKRNLECIRKLMDF